jgi:hypothetical protein
MVMDMTSEMTPLLWKALNQDQDGIFRRQARLMYRVGSHVDMLWHPVYLHECYLMNKEAGILKVE